ncbi:hypothetical protein BGX27_000994 [Mortierella sp. AM989]|nr:hypothetical protein BGX27_000994 [Mortierella sp. AM989]
MAAIERLQEFLSASVEFLDKANSLSPPTRKSHAKKTASTTSNSNDRSGASFVPCPNNPQAHARIPKLKLKQHLEKCKASNTLSVNSFSNTTNHLNRTYPPPPPIGGPPSSRLVHPPPKSENFYQKAPETITIVYKAHEEKLKRSIAHDEDPDPALLNAGLYRLDHPGLGEVFMYDPPIGSASSVKQNNSSYRSNNADLYEEHCRLVNIIKSAIGASISDTSHDKVAMTDLSLLIPKNIDITTEMVKDRIQEIQKQRSEERRENNSLAQLQLEREKRQRRKTYRRSDERLEIQQEKALLDSAGILETDKELIRKLLATGPAGAWRAAIVIFLKDLNLAREAIAELELEKEKERRRRERDKGDRVGHPSSRRSVSPSRDDRSRKSNRSKSRDRERRDWSRDRRYRSPDHRYDSRDKKHREHSPGRSRYSSSHNRDRDHGRDRDRSRDYSRDQRREYYRYNPDYDRRRF